MTLEDLQILLFDLHDIRDALTPDELGREKSDSSETIGEALDYAIAALSELEAEYAEVTQ